MDNAGHACISDLGLAVSYNPEKNRGKVKGRGGTPGYWAPEMIKKEPYGPEADWWSTGCVVYELLSGTCPFSPKVTKKKTHDEGTLEHDVEFPPVAGDCTKDFILQLLQRDPAQRLGVNGVDQIQQHAFFSDLNWERMAEKEVPPPVKPGKVHIVVTCVYSYWCCCCYFRVPR